ncbi:MULTISPECIES: stage III sporulation protein AD [Salibacterium]|uniref:Stage III sporulation protein AD n=2 Tax=Salibacterium TaxID=1884429 RepID=A0A1I4JNP1_9BACI|nr:stage III sporulation protein AD [Salibacterium qingdaonense]SFL68218.1 stage III sporulation protein AD [Salibacterium qingdaonense]
MEIIQIVGFGLIAVFLIIIVREQNPALASAIALAAGGMIFLFVTVPLQSAVELIATLSGQAGINQMYIQTLLKIIGIAYLAEFGAHLARDAELESIAAKIELAGKMLIIMLAVPIFQVLIETVMSLLPGGV